MTAVCMYILQYINITHYCFVHGVVDSAYLCERRTMSDQYTIYTVVVIHVCSEESLDSESLQNNDNTGSTPSTQIDNNN
jgi:hypothetical protein